MNSQLSKPKPGDLSRSLDFLCDALTNPRLADSTAKSAALREVSRLVGVVFQQALKGDNDSGYLLAEILTFLAKNRKRLEQQNEKFQKHSARWRSARVAISKAPSLRKLIHEIVAKATREKNLFFLVKGARNSLRLIAADKALSALPNLAPSPEIVNEWTDKVVYPKLRSMAAELRDHPHIGKMKKAEDKNGKFQVSRLKPLARKAVEKIATVPRAFYFDIC